MISTNLSDIVKKEKEICVSLLRHHIHITFITVYCYNCSILLSVVAADFFLCLIYKLHFTTGMHAQEKRQSIQGQVLFLLSGIHWEPWDVFSCIRGDYCTRRGKGWEQEGDHDFSCINFEILKNIQVEISRRLLEIQG